MLYATTRNKTDTYTAYRALYDSKGADGGFYVPFRKTVMDSAAVDALTEQPFADVVSQVLSLFFPGRITPWDIECCVGKGAIPVTAMPHRVLLTQLWNNPAGDSAFIYEAIYRKLCREKSENTPSDWARLAIGISLLFGIYAIIKKMGIRKFDIAVNSGDFNTPMAAWYARRMGLPIGTIICACNENSTPWDFLHRGELNTGAAVIPTVTQALDCSYPAGIERLIYETFGIDEVKKFISVCDRKGVYQLRPDMLSMLNKGIFASVIGNDRVESVIGSVYRGNGCILDPYTAVSYGSLQDYRSKTGESCPTVLLAEKSPAHYEAVVRQATGLSQIK